MEGNNPKLDELDNSSRQNNQLNEHFRMEILSLIEICFSYEQNDNKKCENKEQNDSWQMIFNFLSDHYIRGKRLVICNLSFIDIHFV